MVSAARRYCATLRKVQIPGTKDEARTMNGVGLCGGGVIMRWRIETRKLSRLGKLERLVQKSERMPCWRWCLSGSWRPHISRRMPGRLVNLVTDRANYRGMGWTQSDLDSPFDVAYSGLLSYRLAVSDSSAILFFYRPRKPPPSTR